MGLDRPTTAIDPVALGGYLVSRAWERHGSWRGADVWQKAGHARLLVPPRIEYPDDDELLWAAIRKLAEAEGRSTRELLLDIAEPAVDIPFFQLHPNSASGTIPLPAALKAIQGIHDALKVSAQTVEAGPKLLYTGHRSKYVDQFLHDVRVGTTRPGSYIFDVRVPVAPAGQLTLDWPMTSELSGRAVIIQLYQASKAVHSAATYSVQQLSGLGSFVEVTGEGVSANLCRAMAALGGGAEQCRPFDIGFTWARVEATDLPTATLSFTQPMVRVVARAAALLEKVARSGGAAITGTVETLKRPDSVQIKGLLVTESPSAEAGPDTAEGAAWVSLTPNKFQQAIEALRDNRSLRVRGSFAPDSRRLEILPAPGGFEVL
ncbi:hypothetical protein GL307_14110 [Nocardia seriolae]|uniref:hypothetical protein n=1 Tax=Nocardia seriolae TaxID=37332 RepID=UPI0012BCDC56|nr:hypothetical protein [Nocardia seriolae]MTL12686.1 hypothetical protein [Nocardia seriolae]